MAKKSRSEQSRPRTKIKDLSVPEKELTGEEKKKIRGGVGEVPEDTNALNEGSTRYPEPGQGGSTRFPEPGQGGSTRYPET